MRVNHNRTTKPDIAANVVSDLCKDTKMRVNHNVAGLMYSGLLVVSDLCKDTKMRVNHNTEPPNHTPSKLFLIYAKILK